MKNIQNILRGWIFFQHFFRLEVFAFFSRNTQVCEVLTRYYNCGKYIHIDVMFTGMLNLLKK